MAWRNAEEFAPVGLVRGWPLPGVGRWLGRVTPWLCMHWRNEALLLGRLLDPDEGVDELLAAEHPLARAAASSTGPATRQDR
jgi:hypothetical protein